MQGKSDLLITSDSDIMHYEKGNQIIYHPNPDILSVKQGAINNYPHIMDTNRSSLR